MVQLRPASETDAPGIRALVHQAQINPLDLDWPRFIVAVSPDGELVGCGQVKTHRDGSRELASIVVAPAFRNQGIARAIIERLSESHPGTLYLTCRSSLGPFYEKLGYQIIQKEEMPLYFRRISHLFRLMSRAHLVGEGLLVMRRERESNISRLAG
jgi:amino-acid N-acetyltransferase